MIVVPLPRITVVKDSPLSKCDSSWRWARTTDHCIFEKCLATELCSYLESTPISNPILKQRLKMVKLFAAIAAPVRMINTYFDPILCNNFYIISELLHLIYVS